MASAIAGGHAVYTGIPSFGATTDNAQVDAPANETLSTQGGAANINNGMQILADWSDAWFSGPLRFLSFRDQPAPVSPRALVVTPRTAGRLSPTFRSWVKVVP